MGWAARNKHKGPGMEPAKPSEAERIYRVRYSHENYKKGEGFQDVRGRNYMARPDGSLQRGGTPVQIHTAPEPFSLPTRAAQPAPPPTDQALHSSDGESSATQS